MGTLNVSNKNNTKKKQMNKNLYMRMRANSNKYYMNEYGSVHNLWPCCLYFFHIHSLQFFLVCIQMFGIGIGMIFLAARWDPCVSLAGWPTIAGWPRTPKRMRMRRCSTVRSE